MPKPIIIIKKDVDSQINQLQAQLVVANNSIISLTDLLATKTSELSLANADIASLNNQIADINSQLTTANNNVNLLNNQLTTANATIAIRDNTIVGLNNQITGLNNSLTTANNSIANLNNTIVAKDNTINSLSDQLTTANNTINNLSNQLTTANGSLVVANTQISNILTVCSNIIHVPNTDFTQHNNDVIIQSAKPLSGYRVDNFSVFIYCNVPSGKNCVSVIQLSWHGGTVTPLWNSTSWNQLAVNLPIRAVGNNPATGMSNWSITANGVQIDFAVSRKPTDSGNYIRIAGIGFGVKQL